MITALMWYAATAVSGPTPPAWVPFQFVGQHIYLSATVNGRAVSLLLDTGATASYLDTGVTKPATTTGRAVVALQIPGIVRNSFTTGVLPLGFSAFDGRSVDGLLGYDFLKDFAIEIDYARSRLRFHPAAGYQLPPDFTALPVRLLEDDSGGKLPLAAVQLTAADGSVLTGELIVDTGARGTVVLTTPFGKRARWFAPDAPLRNPLVGSGALVKNLRLSVGRIRSLELGPFSFTRPVVGLAQDTTGILSLAEFDGVIGGELLSRFTVVFDYGNGRLGLRPNARLKEGFAFDQCGCTVVATRTGIEVADVLPNSPAADAGLLLGDRLVAVGRLSASPSRLDLVRTLLRGTGPIRLLVRRGGQHLAITLNRQALL